MRAFIRRAVYMVAAGVLLAGVVDSVVPLRGASLAFKAADLTNAFIQGVSCADADHCMAVGGQSTAGGSTRPIVFEKAYNHWAACMVPKRFLPDMPFYMTLIVSVQLSV